MKLLLEKQTMKTGSSLFGNIYNNVVVEKNSIFRRWYALLIYDEQKTQKNVFDKLNIKVLKTGIP